MKSEATSAAPWARVCYGIDASGSDLLVVRAERRGRQLNYTSLPFDASLLAAENVSGAAIACGMPVGLGIASWVVAPLASVSKARRVFPTLLDIQLPFPLEDCVYHFAEAVQSDSVSLPPAAQKGALLTDPIGALKKSSGVAALAVAARISDIERRLSVLGEVGVDPHVLDHEGVALWTQSLYEQPAKVLIDAPLRVVVYMRGEDGIMAIGRGDTFWSAHRVSSLDPMSVDRYLRAPLSQMESGGASPNHPIEWLWSGSGLDVGGSGASLRSEVEQRWHGQSTTLKNPESFLARALATRALLPGPLRANLRCGALSHQGATAKTQGGRTRSAAVLLAAGLLLCGVSAAWEYSVAARQKMWSKAFSKRMSAVVGYPVVARGENAFLIAGRELDDRRQRLKSMSAVFGPSQVAVLQEVLLVLNQQKVQVEHLQLDAGTLQVKGLLPGKAADPLLRNALKELGFQSEIKLGDLSGESHIRFALSAVHEESYE